MVLHPKEQINQQFSSKLIAPTTQLQRPYEIGFLLVDGFSLMSFASASEPLRVANLISGKNLYNVRNVPIMGSLAESSNGVLVKASAQIGENVDFDLLIVIAEPGSADLKNLRVMQWLQLLSKRGVALGGVGAGALLLANAGLMEGRAMALHDECINIAEGALARLKRSKDLFVIDEERCTCVGGTSAIDMMHSLIEMHHGEDLATNVSELLSQNKARRQGNLSHLEIRKQFNIGSMPELLAIEAMLENVSEPFSLAALSVAAKVGTRQLNRLFQQSQNCGTMQFYKGIRLDEANKLIANTVLPIAEIARLTGFVSSAHFAKAFRDKFGKQPSVWRSETS